MSTMFVMCRCTVLSQRYGPFSITHPTQLYKAFDWLIFYSGQSGLTLQLFPLETIVTSNLIGQNKKKSANQLQYTLGPWLWPPAVGHNLVCSQYVRCLYELCIEKRDVVILANSETRAV